MTFSQLLNLARIALKDTAGSLDAHHLLKEATAVAYFNEAIHEACRRARLIVDRTTPSICTISVLASNPILDLSPKIIKVRQVRLTGKTNPLIRRYSADMDEKVPGWEDQTGTVDSYVADYEPNKIRLFRIPADLTTANLVVVRLPINDLTGNPDQEPEIKPQYHAALVPYVVYKMRNIEDTELYDPRKADKALAEFEAEFGPKRSASSEMYENSQPYEEYE